MAFVGCNGHLRQTIRLETLYGIQFWRNNGAFAPKIKKTIIKTRDRRVHSNQTKRCLYREPHQVDFQLARYIKRWHLYFTSTTLCIARQYPHLLPICLVSLPRQSLGLIYPAPRRGEVGLSGNTNNTVFSAPCRANLLFPIIFSFIANSL